MSLILKGIDLPSKDKSPLVITVWADGVVCSVDSNGGIEETTSAIQIPKGHGRLKDDKEILARAEQEVDGLVMSAEHLPMVLEWILGKCDTILEAEE